MADAIRRIRTALRVRTRLRAFLEAPPAEAIGKVLTVHPRLVLAPGIMAVPDGALRTDPRDGFNQLCDISDWRDGRFQEICRELREPVHIHRKAWECAKCIDGLERLGAVREDAWGLSVGAGAEPSLYYFANRVTRMLATDLYSQQEGHWGWHADFLQNPAKYSRFPYREANLEVRDMSGLELDLESSRFDFVYSLSSIEHFGGHGEAALAMREMARVVKPGGIVCIATEVLLNDTESAEFFTVAELQEYVIAASGLKLAGSDLDLRVSESLLAHPIQIDKESDRISPHIVLMDPEGHVWTSAILFLTK